MREYPRDAVVATSSRSDPPSSKPCGSERAETRSAEERLALLTRTPLLDYPRARRARDELADVLARQIYAAPSCVMLCGPAGNGRTTVATRFVEETNHRRDRTVAMLMPMPASASCDASWTAWLGALGIADGNRLSTCQRVLLAEHLLHQLVGEGLRLVVFDDCDQLAAADPAARRSVLDCIGFVRNRIGLATVVVATQSLAFAVLADRDRLADPKLISLPRWQMNADFRDLVADWDAALPLRRYSGLADRHLVRRLYEICGGRLGPLDDVLRRAAVAAIRDGSERITSGLLDRLEVGFCRPGDRVDP